MKNVDIHLGVNSVIFKINFSSVEGDLIRCYQKKRQLNLRFHFPFTLRQNVSLFTSSDTYEYIIIKNQYTYNWFNF